jgi:uncharacterized protein (TIGR03067 family)
MNKLATYVTSALLFLGANTAAIAGHHEDTTMHHAQTMDQGLKGHWKVIGCMLNTKWLPREIFMMFRYEITEGAFKIHWASLSYPKWTGSFPKSDTGAIKHTDGRNIDFIPSKGPHKGKVFKGIYELDHDLLKANFAFPGHSRPKSFDAKQGQVYEVWQRIHQTDDTDI